MERETNEWVISGDNESYCTTECRTLEEAITEGLRQYRQALRGQDTDCFAPGACHIEEAVFYVGTQTQFVPTVNAHNVIEELQAQAYDLCDEYAEDYLSHVSASDVDALQRILQHGFNRWQAANHLEPTFFVVKDARKVRVADYKQQLASLCIPQKSDGTATERLC